MDITDERYFTTSQVARILQVSDQAVRRWIYNGQLVANKPGKEFRISETHLREFLRESEAAPKVPAELPLPFEPAGSAHIARHVLVPVPPEIEDLLMDNVREALDEVERGESAAGAFERFRRRVAAASSASGASAGTA